MSKLNNKSIVHPKLNNKVPMILITDTILNYFESKFKLFPKISHKEDTIILEFSKSLEANKGASFDLIGNDISRLLYKDYGLVSRVSINENKYNIQLNEQINKEELTAEVDANIILDNRFIWLFDLLDEHSQPIEENVINLEDAIDMAVEDANIKLIVANPYIDPDPKNNKVDLVFADNPGPIIIYDGIKPKQEELAVETTQADDINTKVSYLKSKAKKKKNSSKKATSEKTFKQIPKNKTPKSDEGEKPTNNNSTIDVKSSANANMSESEVYQYIKQLINLYQNEYQVKEEFKAITQILVYSNQFNKALDLFVKLMTILKQKATPDTRYNTETTPESQEAEQTAKLLFDRVVSAGSLFKQLGTYIIAQVSAENTVDTKIVLDDVAKEAQIEI